MSRSAGRGQLHEPKIERETVFKYLYLVLQQDILTVLLGEFRYTVGVNQPLLFFSFSFNNLHNLFQFILTLMPFVPLS
jgi:hypothetical protein